MPTRSVGIVAGRTVTLDELEAREAELRRGPRGKHLARPDGQASAEARRWLARELVTDVLIRQELEARDLDTVESLVAAVTADVGVAEPDVRDYYRRNGDLFSRAEERRVRLALVRRPGEPRPPAPAAADIRGLLREASPLTVRRGELVGALEDAIFASGPGDVIGPLETEHGWWIGRLEAVVPATTIPFEVVRRAIEVDLLVAARSRAFDDWLERRRRAVVRLEPEFEHPANPVVGAPSHRH